jgi:hypothetical protein
VPTFITEQINHLQSLRERARGLCELFFMGLEIDNVFAIQNIPIKKASSEHATPGPCRGHAQDIHWELFYQENSIGKQ